MSDAPEIGSHSASAQRATLRLLAGYLALTAVPILRQGFAGGAHAAVACVHMTTLAAVLAALALADERRSLGSWMSLILWPALYAEIPLVITGLGTSFHDGVVQSWELAVFHGQPAQTLASQLPSKSISELLHLAYLTYYPLIYLPPLTLSFRGRKTDFDETVLAVTAVWLACLAAFAVYPVAGPRYLVGEPPGVPQGPARAFAVWLLERGSSRGTAFPSSHVAVSVVQSLMALRFQRRVGIAASVATVLLAIGAVYGGFHYAVDVIAGAFLGVLVFCALILQRSRRVAWPAANLRAADDGAPASE